MHLENNFSIVSGLSASRLPFFVKYKPSSETANTCEVSILQTSSTLSPFTPNRKPKFANDFSAAIWYFSANTSRVNTFGNVFGMSIKEVTPPATAARLSVYRSPLCVNPGSLKCTWPSIIPGNRYLPVPSISRSSVSSSKFPIASIKPSLIRRSARVILPSFTIKTFFISVDIDIVDFLSISLNGFLAE